MNSEGRSPVVTKQLIKRLAWTLGLILLVVTCLSIYRAFHVPSLGTIKAPARSIDPNASPASKPPTSVTGKHVSFSLPSSFNASSNNNHEDNTNSDNFFYTHKLAVGSEHVAIGAYPSPQGPSESSGFLIRNQAPDKYTRETTTIDGASAYVFTSTAGDFEQTAFVAKSGVLVSISYTASTSANPELFQKLLLSFKIH